MKGTPSQISDLIEHESRVSTIKQSFDKIPLGSIRGLLHRIVGARYGEEGLRQEQKKLFLDGQCNNLTC